jgi:hypothetical protein
MAEKTDATTAPHQQPRTSTSPEVMDKIEDTNSRQPRAYTHAIGMLNHAPGLQTRGGHPGVPWMPVQQREGRYDCPPGRGENGGGERNRVLQNRQRQRPRPKPQQPAQDPCSLFEAYHHGRLLLQDAGTIRPSAGPPPPGGRGPTRRVESSMARAATGPALRGALAPRSTP